jgi:hypothetical protein
VFIAPSATLRAYLHGDGAMPEVTEPLTPATPEGAAAPEAVEDSKLGENGEKALKAEREARKAAEKRATDAEAKVTEAERAKLSEAERVQAERDDARRDRDEARAEAVRLRVGAKYGLSAEDVEDLSTAGTPEDFDARAKRLAERLAASPGAKPAGGLPPAPNAGRSAKRPNGSAAGLEEAQRRFGKPA